MFLATTALSEFWDPRQEIVLLGQWCLRFDRREEWRGLKYETMPSPWADRMRFYDAVRYVDESSERMLGRLGPYLDSVHRVNHSPRYWRILIGPWLIHYLHALYDRYVHLTDAFNRYSELHTILLAPESFRVPSTLSDFIEGALDDHYNLQLYSQLLTGLGKRFATRTLQSWPRGVVAATSGGGRLSTARRSLARSVSVMTRLLEKRRRVALCGIHGLKGTPWLIAGYTALRALPMPTEMRACDVVADPMFDAKRTGLSSLPFSDEFEGVFVKSLPQNFPTLYLEGYGDAHAEILRKWQRFPRVIASATGWYFNESFKHVAAEASERGSRLVAFQHGGGYGIPRFTVAELHEARLADSFFVWGWAESGGAPYRNLPSPKLSSLMSAVRKTGDPPRKSVLFVSTAYLRYLLRFHSFQVGLELDDYFRWQVNFLTAVPDRIRRVLLFRPYHTDRGAAPLDSVARCTYLRERFGDLRFDETTRFYSSLKASRLVVIDHLGTTLLESLRYGVPTILFWSPLWSDVRAEAMPYFEDLRAVGVLWDSPEKAAAKVAEIYDDPLPWWESGPVRSARQRFVDRYALGRADWATLWRAALNKELALSREERAAGSARHIERPRIA